jgi:hypothetical protein
MAAMAGQDKNQLQTSTKWIAKTGFHVRKKMARFFWPA